MSTSAHADAEQQQQDPNAHDHLQHQNLRGAVSPRPLPHQVLGAAVRDWTVGLGFPGAIHRRGGAATISDLVTDAGVHPAKRPHLRRLMRMLTCFGIFGVGEQRAAADDGDDDCESETVYTLTPVSSVLVGDKDRGITASGAASLDMSALLHLLARPSTSVSTFFSLEEWFKDGGTTTLFEMAHCLPPWSLTKNDAAYSKALNEGCAVDTSLAMDIMLKDITCRGGGVSIFSGLTSLVDVGGAMALPLWQIATAFPHINCSVLDLEQVITKVPAGTDHVHSTVQFIAGDMFESIPPADAVFLRNVLDCWDDDHCVKILRQCKRAIPSRDAGGKVIIMNAVVRYGSLDKVVKETQVLFDMYMMRYDGSEREEHEWRKIFSKAGFRDYKITPILGFHSIIEVFP